MYTICNLSVFHEGLQCYPYMHVGVGWGNTNPYTLGYTQNNTHIPQTNHNKYKWGLLKWTKSVDNILPYPSVWERVKLIQAIIQSPLICKCV